MAKAHTAWKVLPHGPLETLTDNIWRVEGTLPDMPLKRVFTVVRLADGCLLLHNAIALDEVLMAEIEGWGVPRYLVVPNGWHRLDARIFKQRYPRIEVICPRGARRKVEQVVEIAGSYDDVDLGRGVELAHLDGVGQMEGVLQVSSSDGVTLVFNDIIFNMVHLPGVFGLVYRLIGSTGGARVTHVARLMMVKDREALAAHLQRLANVPDLRRVIVSHGAMESADPAGMVRRAVATLG